MYVKILYANNKIIHQIFEDLNNVFFEYVHKCKPNIKNKFKSVEHMTNLKVELKNKFGLN